MTPAATLSAARPASPGWLSLTSGVLAVLIAGIIGLTVGPAELPAGSVLAALTGAIPGLEPDHGLTEIQSRVLYDIRFPRVLLGGMVGAVLAAAGAGFQGVFRNPLADPYLLGVAAGAGLGATLAFAAEADVVVAPLAFAGGLGAVLVSYVLGRSVGGRTATSLILAGVAVAAFATALQTYILQRKVETIREVYSWILGRLGTVGWGEVLRLAPYLLVALAVLFGGRRLLDVLAIGDDEASALGVRVPRVRWTVVLVATLATAAAVSASGLIGFVGIIVPHAIRLIFGWSYRVIIPLSVLYGAAFLMLADVFARTVVAPGELPIGVVTAFLGAPFFVLVLRTMGRQT